MTSPIAPTNAIKTEHPPDCGPVAIAFQINRAHVEGGAHNHRLLPGRPIPSRVNLGRSTWPLAVQFQPRGR
jgi:hypothetical protein